MATRVEKKAARAAARSKRRLGEMTLVEHLEELRKRLLLSLLFILLGAMAGWFLYAPALRILVDPYRRATGSNTQRLVFQGVAEPFLIKLKVSAFIGLALALPFVLYQIWRFVTPGLNQKERHYAAPFIISAVFLFALGAFFAYLTFPTALKFLLGFGGPHPGAPPTAERDLSLVFLLILALPGSFRFPVLLHV